MGNDEVRNVREKAGVKVSAPTIGTLAVIAVLSFVFWLLAPRYLSTNNIIDIFRTVSVRFVVSLAMGVVIASGGFDLSIGHVAGFSGLITAYMLVNLKLGIPESILGGVLVGTSLGCVNGVIVGWLGVSSFITTLGMQMVIVGLRYWLTNGTTIMNLPKAFNWYGAGKVSVTSDIEIPVIVIIAFIILLIMLFVMHRTTLGRRIISVGQNLEASRLSGINPRIYTALALILSGALCGIAGVLIVARNGLANVDVGDKYLLEAMTMAVLAHVMFGKFKTHGVMLMTVFIIMLTNGLTMLGVDPSFMDMIRGTMLIVVIVFGKLMQYLRNRRRTRAAPEIRPEGA